MLERFRRRTRNRAIVDRLYAQIVERSRQPRLYTEFGLPDSVMGRFEALGIQVFLFLARCRTEPELQPLSQDVVDRFMRDLDGSIRELGIGYLAVPKRMRKLAGLFYTRVDAYDPPWQAGDVRALAAALRRHATDREAPPDAAEALASYMIAEKARFAAVDKDRILAGDLGQARADDIERL